MYFQTVVYFSSGRPGKTKASIFFLNSKIRLFLVPIYVHRFYNPPTDWSKWIEIIIECIRKLDVEQDLVPISGKSETGITYALTINVAFHSSWWREQWQDVSFQKTCYLHHLCLAFSKLFSSSFLILFKGDFWNCAASSLWLGLMKDSSHFVPSYPLSFWSSFGKCLGIKGLFTSVYFVGNVVVVVVPLLSWIQMRPLVRFKPMCNHPTLAMGLD